MRGKNNAFSWYCMRCLFSNNPIVILTSCPLSFLGDWERPCGEMHSVSSWIHIFHENDAAFFETRHIPFRNCCFHVHYMFQLKKLSVQKQFSILLFQKCKPYTTPFKQWNIDSFRTNAIVSQKYYLCKRDAVLRQEYAVSL